MFQGVLAEIFKKVPWIKIDIALNTQLQRGR